MAQPQLGYGKPTEATIDQVNTWMRSTPWYQQTLKQWGQDPGHPTLTKSQSAHLVKLAQANGVQVDEGAMEVDDHGNFNPKGHKLRNTLVVAGIAGATIATMGAAGVFAGGAGAASGASAAAGGGAAAAGGSAAAGTGLASGAAAAAGAGMKYGDLLKYVLPEAGQLVGGLIQSNAQGKANDAQQKYLEEALAYQKEQDAFNRARQTGLDTQENSRYTAALAKEAGRYGDYQGRIAPWIQNGTSSNDRMAALLGLPARPGGSGGGASGPASRDPILDAGKLSAADRLKVDALLKASNSSDNPAYWYGVNAQHGGFDATGADWNQQRISTGDGVGKGYAGATTAPQPMSTASPQAPVQMKAPDGSIQAVDPAHVDHYTSLGATPVDSGASAPVQMRAPDGSVKTVSADQVAHFTQLGATVLQGAA